MNRLYYIYKLILPNDKIYIGQAVDIGRRFESYRNLRCQSQIKLYESLKLYHWDNIKIEILYCNVTNQIDIDIREKLFIQSISLELRLNIRDSVKTFPIKRGKDNKNSKPILQIDKELNIVKKWECLSELKENFHKNSTNISKCIAEKTYFAYGFYWCHEKDYNIDLFKPIKNPNYNCKKVIQLTKRGNYIRTFNSITEAANFVKGLTCNISEVCRQKKASAYGYIWAFEEDYLKEDFLKEYLHKFEVYNNIHIFHKKKLFPNFHNICLNKSYI